MTLPDCGCADCVRRQFERMAPRNGFVRAEHNPLRIQGVRPVGTERRSVAERLERPAI